MSTNAYQALATALRKPFSEERVASVQALEWTRAGILAASSHNSQPWKFAWREEAHSLEIQPDFARRCAVVDPHDAHLWKSLGCAAENVRQAAKAQGMQANILCSNASIRVDFEKSSSLSADALSRAITTRQCTRLPFARDISLSDVSELLEASQELGVHAKWLDQKTFGKSVLDYITAGNDEQFNDPRFRSELVEWIRFNDAEALQKQDGLASRTTFAPSMPRWLAKPLLPIAMNARTQNKADASLATNSAGFFVFFGENHPQTWFGVGRSFQRLALLAASKEIRLSFLNQPIEASTVRDQFARWLDVQGMSPLLLVRCGRGPKAPYSLRRDLSVVVTSQP